MFEDRVIHHFIEELALAIIDRALKEHVRNLTETYHLIPAMVLLFRFALPVTHVMAKFLLKLLGSLLKNDRWSLRSSISIHRVQMQEM